MTSYTNSKPTSPNGRFNLPMPASLLAVLLVMLGLFVVMNYSSITLLIEKWDSDDNYSHGFLIPFIGLYFVWSKKEELAKLKSKPALTGLPIFVIGMILWFVATGTTSTVGGGLAIVIMVSALLLYLGGWSIYRVLWLPALYLLFMVPLPAGLHDRIALPLQHFASYVSSGVLGNILGVPLARDGNVIRLAAGHTLQVEEACSGIRSIMGLLALGVAFSYFWERPLWERLLLIASTIPIALTANICRVVVTAMLYNWGYAEFAQGFYHEFTGWFVFLFAMALFLLEAFLLSKLFLYEDPEKTKEDKQTGEPAADASSDPAPTARAAATASGGTFRLHRHFYAAIVLLAVPAVSWPWMLETKPVEPVPLREKLATIPKTLDLWHGEDMPMDPKIRAKTEANDILQRSYERGEEAPIHIYIAYWGGLRGRAPHRPSACRPGAGWILVSSKVKDYELDGFQDAVRVHEEIYAKESRTDVVVWWEYLHGKNISSQWVQRVLMLLPGWLGGKKGSILQVQVTTGQGEKEDAERGLACIKEFMSVLAPHLQRVLPVEDDDAASDDTRDAENDKSADNTR